MHYSKNEKKNFPTAGFSLLETTIALVLIATVLLSLLSFFPSLLKISRRSEGSTQALFIAQSIFSTLEVSTSNPFLLTASDGFHNAQHQLHFSLQEPASYDVAYNKEGEPVRLLTTEEAKTPLKENNITHVVHLTIYPDHLLLRITHLELSISSPANVVESKRQQLTFHKLISNKLS